MRKYIVDLTNNLISKHRYYEVLCGITDPKEFVKHVTISLAVSDVGDMSPSRLGDIMCSFQVGDVMTSQKELFDGLHFAGDCGAFLRELVSFCLACAIRDRLSDERPTGTPPWERRKEQ